MTSQVEKDFLRLIMMLHEIVLPVCKAYFKNNVLLKEEYKGDLKKFLQDHKHDIYHLVHSVMCCQCVIPFRGNDNNRLFGKQFDKFYCENEVKIQDHVKWGANGKIRQHCICVYKVVDTCSVKDMDISMVNAIIQTCVQGLIPAHKMWLKNIIQQRNELCHVEDLNHITTNETDTMWYYLKESTLGLAGSIPLEDYKESVKRHIQSFKRVEFQREEVKQVLDSMKEEFKVMKECFESMKEQLVQVHLTMNGVKAVPQQIKKLEEYTVNHCRISNEENETRKKEIQNTVLDAQKEISEQIGAQTALTSSAIIETRDEIKETIKEESMNILQELKKGTLQHKNREVEFNVELSEQGRNVGKGTGDVVVTWSISEDKFTEKEKAEILQNMHKVEQTAAIWLPYKFEYSGCGSIVIGTLLNKDVFLDKDKFESSIRLFLDRFLAVSGIDCNLPCTINVKVVISEGPRKGIITFKSKYDVVTMLVNELNCGLTEFVVTLNKDETDRLLAKYFDKIHQVVPEMLEETSEGVVKQWIELPLVYSLNLPPTVGEATNCILLISDKSDTDITRQIVEMLPRDFINTQKQTLPDCLKDTIWQPRTRVSAGHRTSDYLKHPRRRRRCRCKDAYVVIADTHTKRTAIKVFLELLQFTTCIALVPFDGLRINDISTESIDIDKDLTWKKSVLEKIQLSFGMIYRRFLFVPPMVASESRSNNPISIVIMSSVLDQDKMNTIYRALEDYTGHSVYFELDEERQISINVEEIKLQFGESNCILVLSDHSEFLSRKLKMVDPIVASFSKEFNAPGVARFYSKTFALDLLSRILKKNTNQEPRAKRRVWFSGDEDLYQNEKMSTLSSESGISTEEEKDKDNLEWLEQKTCKEVTRAKRVSRKDSKDLFSREKTDEDAYSFKKASTFRSEEEKDKNDFDMLEQKTRKGLCCISLTATEIFAVFIGIKSKITRSSLLS